MESQPQSDKDFCAQGAYIQDADTSMERNRAPLIVTQNAFISFVSFGLYNSPGI